MGRKPRHSRHFSVNGWNFNRFFDILILQKFGFCRQMKLNQNSTLDLRDLEEQFSNQVRKTETRCASKATWDASANSCESFWWKFIRIPDSGWGNRHCTHLLGPWISWPIFWLHFKASRFPPRWRSRAQTHSAVVVLRKLAGPTMTAAKAPLWLWLLGLVAIALAQEKPEGTLAFASM